MFHIEQRVLFDINGLLSKALLKVFHHLSITVGVHVLFALDMYEHVLLQLLWFCTYVLHLDRCVKR